VIASRLSQLNKSVPEQVRPEEPTLGAAALQDLMLQAEILVQYGMRSKAVETAAADPGTVSAGRRTKRRSAAAVFGRGNHAALCGFCTWAAGADRGGAAVAGQAPGAPAAVHGEQADVSSFTRVAEITRKLYHQNNANAVLATAAHEMGSQWNVTRCVAAMRKPGLPPTAVQQFHADGTPSGESPALASVITACQELAVARGAVNIPDHLTAPEVQPVRRVLAELGVTSLLALPLMDGEDHIGLLLFMQSSQRNWHPSEIVVLKTLGEQVVIALNNAGLRRLVRNLSVTDEKSGLLKRASYLDLGLLRHNGPCSKPRRSPSCSCTSGEVRL